MKRSQAPTTSHPSWSIFFILVLTSALIALLHFYAPFSYLSPISESFASLARNPRNKTLAVFVASDYVKEKLLNKSEELLHETQEYAAFQLPFFANVLGDTSEIKSLEQKIATDTQGKTMTYHRWQMLASHYPKYKDAYVQLVYAAYALNQLDQARIHFVQLKNLDPLAESLFSKDLLEELKKD